ncbi:MAG: NFYB/HAP3 family transcription factor subunit [Alkalibacterium sp.]|nr:NFYB/HAP3 family transcription factor subunit [Alkalibacterium sp.]
MKKALPPHAKLSKESKECIQECASEFISFITSQASDRGRLEKRKTLNGEDILWAMHILGFENYSETLKIYLAKYRQVCIFIHFVVVRETVTKTLVRTNGGREKGYHIRTL